MEIFEDQSERSTLLMEFEALKKEILTDPLTGLGNRRYAEIIAASAIRDLEAEGIEFGLIIFDIDYFKAVNDEFGHAIGDRVLRIIGWTFANAIRRNDAAIRWGGEEFLAICPRVKLPVLMEVAERARSLIDRSCIGLENGWKVFCTISAGSALAHHGENLETLVARADDRLYACKAAGRNRITVGD